MKKPLYYQRFYAKIYENEELSKILDHYFFSQLLSCFQKKRINASVLKEIKPNSNVLVIGVSFGDFIDNIAQKAKKVTVLDISKTQISLQESKFEFVHSNINYILQNATVVVDRKFDIVICNNILHEVPIATKTKIVNNALSATQKDGKTFFIDYHNPRNFMFKYFVRMFNRLYQPFAEKMWDRSIETYATEKHKYSWKKTTFFFSCFQKTTAKKKNIHN
ncbi:MAG: methyltransferase domain-containing protein [Alphaproteobacteria bacterium]